MPDDKRHTQRTVRKPKSPQSAGTPSPARALLPLCVALCFAPMQEALALEFGAIEPRSSLGEPFAARVPLQFAQGEELGLQCIRLLPHPDAAQGMPLPPQLRLELETIGNTRWLAIRTPAVVSTLAIGLRIEVDCNKQVAENFIVLLDPPVEQTAPQTESPAVPTTRPASNAPDVQLASDSTGVPLGGGDNDSATTRKSVAATRGPKAGRSAAHGKPALQLDTGPLPAAPKKAAAVTARKLPSPAAAAPAPTSDNAPAAQVSVSDNTPEERELFERIQHMEASLAVMRTALENHRPALVRLPPLPPEPVPQVTEDDELPWLAGGGVLAALGLTGAMLWWRRRKRAAALALEEAEAEPESWAAAAATRRRIAMALAGKPAAAPAAEHVHIARQAPAPALPQAPQVKSAQPAAAAVAPASAQAADDALANAAPQEPIVFIPPGDDNDRAAQEAYFAGRFGAHTDDIKILQDSDSVIEQARSIYQDDNDPLKAADMLELTVALRPQELKLWLALFAIYRRQSMTRQYALLAGKFTARFATDPSWPQVQQLGREIDADNALYRASADGAGHATDGSMQQDLADEWLGVQLDFNSSLLATELREQLISDAAADAPPLAVNAR